MKEVKKAVITAAGLGTRMMPISYAVAKEMLPIVDLPAIYYLALEAVNSGITDILIITARGKEAIEDFFDISAEAEKIMLEKGMTEQLFGLKKIKNSANLYFLRQNEPGGLGQAVLCAKSFVSDEPFAVLYGDDVIFSDRPVVRQLIDAYKTYGKSIVGAKRVSPSDISKYSSLKVEEINGSTRVALCTDMIEKPKSGEEFSCLSILGRVLLTPDVFALLENQLPGAGGELQLTDAMAQMARGGGIYSLEFEGERFDLGSKVGFLKANIYKGLSHPETAQQLREFIIKTAKDLL